MRHRPNRIVRPASSHKVTHHAGPSRVQEYKKLGARLLGDWKDSLSSESRMDDLIAGVTVAAVALPLNLALAVASGLPPSTGLVAGAVGGIFAILFGGSTFQVTGPAAALTIMVLGISQRFGAVGAAAAALIVGVTQILLGLLLSGRLIRFVPEALLAGFTTGVGIKLLDNQIPEFLGFDYTVFEIAGMLHRPTWLHEVSWIAVVCGLFVSLLVVSLRRFKKFPAALVGASVVTALSVFLQWDLQRVGPIVASFGRPELPLLPTDQWSALILLALPLGFLAAVESLLSAQVLDRMTGTKTPGSPDLELFGQGIANLASGLMMGMPVSGVVVRSSVNVQSGGKTRLASLIHGIILVFALTYLSQELALIPLAALAGLLCVVGLRLVEFDTALHLWKEDRVGLLVFLIAASGTVSGHLMIGLGVALAIHFAHYRFTRDARARHADKNKQSERGLRAVIPMQQAAARRPTGYEPVTHGKSNWLSHLQESALYSKTAFVHKDATVIGRVVLGNEAHIAADTSIRADEGTPFYFGASTNIQDGVVVHALKNKYVQVGSEQWAVYVGKNVSIAHQALVHGPCFIGDHSFIGFKSVIHDSIIGEHCFVGIGATVVGVEIPAGRYVPHGAVIDTADKAEALGEASEQQHEFNDDVVDVNKGLVAAYRKNHIPSLGEAEESLFTSTKPAWQLRYRSTDRF